MSFWSSQKFKSQQGRSVVSGFNDDSVKSGCYNLSLGGQVFISPEPDSSYSDRKIIKLDKNESTIIPAGQFAFLITEETVNIPKNCIGFISIRFGFKSLGIINVSGFHVDPGYSGKLIFAVYNASGFPHKVKRGDAIFSLWISNLDEDDSTPRLKPGFHDMADLPPQVLNINDPISSIPVLSEKIKDIEKNIEASSVKYGLILGLFIPINIALFKYIMDNWKVLHAALMEYYIYVIIILLIPFIFNFSKFFLGKHIKIDINFIKNKK